MRKEEFEIMKFIYPQDEWQCFICLKDNLNLEVFVEETDKIFLICEPCRTETARNLMENKALRGL